MLKLFVIQTRFTLINRNIDRTAWRAGRDGDLNDTIQRLLENDRLKTRSNIFFKYTLPAIDSATKRGYHIIHNILHYDGLPSWLLELLSEAQSKYAWLQTYSFSYEDNCNNYNIIRDEINKWCETNNVKEKVCFAGIRLDDDDIIGSTYFKKLNNYILPGFSGFGVSFPKGIAALWCEDRFSTYAEMNEPKHAQGIAHINTYDFESGKMRATYLLVPGAHKTIDQRVPTILDSRGSPTYIRTFHNSNDIFIGRLDVEKEYLNKIFKKSFNSYDIDTFCND